MLPLLLTVLLMSARSDVPVATGQDKYRPKILQVLKEVAPEVDPELILQQLSRMETDDLVDCSVEVARKYKELKEENENYRKRKDTFVTELSKGNTREKEKHARGQISYLPRSNECSTPKQRNEYIFEGNSE